MKSLKIFFMTAACLLMLNVQAGAASKSLLDVGMDCGGKEGMKSFLISGFGNYPPFSWSELNEEEYKMFKFKNYKYNGFIYEIVNKVLEEMKITRIKEMVFDNFLLTQKAMLHGKADLLFTSYYIDEAKSGLDYIYPAYFGNPFVVISRATKKIDVDGFEGLKGLKGVVRQEEEVEPLIRGSLPTDTKLEVVEGPETAFRKLLSGEVDFMIASPYATEAEAKRFKIRDKLYYGKKVLRHIKYFIAFSKLSPCRKYKDTFGKLFHEQIADKAAVEKKILEYIQIWADRYKDAPALEYEPAQD